LAIETASIVAIATAILGPAVTYGMIRQKVIDLEKLVGNLATKESVESIVARVDDLEDDMKETRHALAAIPLIDQKLTQLEKVNDLQFEDLKHRMKNIQQSLEAFAPRMRANP
jgi:hypothetical protein